MSYELDQTKLSDKLKLEALWPGALSTLSCIHLENIFSLINQLLFCSVNFLPFVIILVSISRLKLFF